MAEKGFLVSIQFPSVRFGIINMWLSKSILESMTYVGYMWSKLKIFFQTLYKYKKYKLYIYCDKISTTWIKISRQNWNGFFSNAKGQIILKGLLVSSNSPKKQTMKFVFNTTTNSFVHFYGEFEDTKKSFRNNLTFSHQIIF